MADFIPDEARFAELKGSVVVVTGGATGIGAATVSRLYHVGALVIFGDVADQLSDELVSSLSAGRSGTGGEVSFVHCDVTSYDDIYKLFTTAYDKYGRIDHSFACAGIFETGNWFSPELTIQSVKHEKGPQATLDINLIGLANFARVAVVFMRENMQQGENKSLTFMSSVNAFRESPGLFMYQTSKHAVQGLMRSMRKPVFERDGIRINTVNPGVTESPMTSHIVHAFKQPGFYCQQPDDVARMVLGLQVQTDLNGKGIYVEGGSGWEFEDGFYREQPAWLGQEPTRRMRANAEAVNKGALTKK